MLLQQLRDLSTDLQGQQVRVKLGSVWRLKRNVPTQQKCLVLNRQNKIVIPEETPNTKRLPSP